MKKIISKILICIGVLVILGGAGFMAYPAITTYLSTEDSNKYLDVLDKQIIENAKKISTSTDEADAKEKKSLKLTTKDLYKGSSKEVQEILKRQHLIGIITIKKLGIRFPIAEGTKRDNIRSSIGRLEQSSPIEQRGGNCVLAGHRGGIYGEFFKNIHMLKKGDKVKIITLDGTVYEYAMFDSKVINPTQVDEACRIYPNDTVLTLLSCTENGKRRLIVRCKLQSVKSLVDAKELQP